MGREGGRNKCGEGQGRVGEVKRKNVSVCSCSRNNTSKARQMESLKTVS